MNKFLAPGILVALLLAGLVLLVTSFNKSSSVTPTHVTAQFVDGVNNGDSREICQAFAPSVLKKYHGLPGCEEYWTSALAQAAFVGQWAGYKVVPHSAVVKGNKATVKFVYLPSRDQKITVNLVKTSHGWKVVNVHG